MGFCPNYLYLVNLKLNSREEMSVYLADFELCMQRVKMELKSDLIGEKENKTRSAFHHSDLFIDIK